MTQQTKQIPVSSIILDEDIYPRKEIDRRRVGIFSESIRDGFTFDPIEVEPCPDKPGYYRLLDGAHRWSVYKSTGVEEVKAIIKDLDGNDPMAGGGVTPDTCLAMGRRCWAFDMMDRPDTRPEIEPFHWDISSDQGLLWPVSAKEKPDLIILIRPTLIKKRVSMIKKAFPVCQKKHTLNFLRAFLFC